MRLNGTFGGFIAWSGLPILPLTGLVLDVQRRWHGYIAVLATTVVVVTVLFVAILKFSSITVGPLHFVGMLSGGYLSALGYLLVIRACGFRLRRVTVQGDPAQHGSAASGR